MVERVTALPKYVREHFTGEMYLHSKKSREFPRSRGKEPRRGGDPGGVDVAVPLGLSPKQWETD